MDVSSTQKWLQDTPLYLDSILRTTSWPEAKDVRMTLQHRLWERAFLLFQSHESCYPLPALPCVICGHMLLCTLVGASMTFPAAPPYSHNTNTTPYAGGQSRWYRVINLGALTVRVLPGTNTCSMRASPIPGGGGVILNGLLHPAKYETLCKTVGEHTTMPYGCFLHPCGRHLRHQKMTDMPWFSLK